MFGILIFSIVSIHLCNGSIEAEFSALNAWYYSQCTLVAGFRRQASSQVSFESDQLYDQASTNALHSSKYCKDCS